MRAVRISAKTAQWLLGIVEQMKGQEAQRAALSLRSSMLPKRSVKASRVVREKKRQTKKEKTAAVREAVMKRADGRCEAASVRETCQFNPRLEMDHFFGRGKVKQSVENCWAICPNCHHLKTRNSPSPEHWLRAFAKHCERHGYANEQRMAVARLDFVSARSALAQGGVR